MNDDCVIALDPQFCGDNMVSANAIGDYRTGVASLLNIQVEEVSVIKQRLGVVVGDDASERATLKDVPLGPFRLHCAVLLHKAQLHMVAVLGANESNNLHSLAVQMRPVLECAGQVVLVVHNVFVDRKAAGKAIDYMDADYYRTIIGATKGQVTHEQLLAHISEIRKEFNEEEANVKKFRQEDKVASLHGGKAWYSYLSDYFCHGRAVWRGHSWRGGVRSMNTVEDEFAFAGFMDYLVNQVAVMNAYAALQIPSEKTLGERTEVILGHLQKVRAEIEVLRDRAMSAIKESSSGEGS